MEASNATSLFIGLDHPAIACENTAALIDWYCRVLGMRVIASNGQTPPSALVGYGTSVSDGAVIEIMPQRDPGPRPADVPRNCQGIRHLALRVSDFDSAYAWLKSAGVQFVTAEPLQALGGGKIISFRDIEGNELQIVQR